VRQSERRKERRGWVLKGVMAVGKPQGIPEMMV
jgi:hypothetical protein